MTTSFLPFYFLGIRFWNADSDALLWEIDRTGGMLAVPSAPSLAQAGEDRLLMRAYQTSDWSVMDGGYVALIVRAMGKSVERISGLQLIQRMLAGADAPVPLRERKVLWVVPSEAEEGRIQKLLVDKGFEAGNQSYYRAPFYQNDDEFRDEALMTQVAEAKPDWIVLCLGGGRQEKLGYYLRQATKEADRRPAILCTGAAIAFFTGGQTAIPTWADRLYLGWFMRVMENPKLYLPRYAKAAWAMPAALWHFRGQWFEPAEEEAVSPAVVPRFDAPVPVIDGERR